MGTVPPRIYGVFARDAPVCALLRRGPTSWVRLIVWRTDEDTVDRGQWFRGRIYDRRSDLSPDGRLFVYFAAKRGTRQAATEVGETWTAVSRPPAFTALALWPKGDSWEGGGRFDGPLSLKINHSCGLEPLNPVPRSLRVEPEPQGGEDLPIYNRILRDKGWRLLTEESPLAAPHYGPTPPGERVDGMRPHVWLKPSPDGKRLLRQEYEGWDVSKPGDPRRFAYSLHDPRTLEPAEALEADWADWDHRGRLARAHAGRLFAGREEIADFRGDRPDA